MVDILQFKWNRFLLRYDFISSLNRACVVYCIRVYSLCPNEELSRAVHHAGQAIWWGAKSPWRMRGLFLLTKTTSSCWATEPCAPGAASAPKGCLFLVYTTVLQGREQPRAHTFMKWSWGEESNLMTGTVQYSEPPCTAPHPNQEPKFCYLIKCIVHDSIFPKRLILEGSWVFMKRRFLKTLSPNLPDKTIHRLVSLRRKLESYYPYIVLYSVWMLDVIFMKSFLK